MRKVQLIGFFMLLCTLVFAQKPNVECVKFRDGFDNFPLPGKGKITLLDGKVIPGEFRQGMTVKLFKWQWYDKKGKLHQILPKQVARVDFYPDQKFVEKNIEVNIGINIGGKDACKVESKNLPFNIKQFKNFEKKKYYSPLVLERVVTQINRKGKEKAKLMVLVNNGFDHKYKVYVDLGHHLTSFGRDFSFTNLIFGNKEMGDYYRSFRVVKVGEKKSILLRKPSGISFLFGAFRNKEFVELFGENKEFMACYPRSFKRKFKYTPEFFWVYDQK
ncbi:MAG: hypothetical protein ACEPOZ_12390 [Marinifilaceae bacterium]